MRTSPWMKGTLLLCITFAAGVAAGVTYERRQLPASLSTNSRDHDPMHHFAQEPDLDAAQRQAISQILANHQADVDATWHAMQPHMRATLDAASQEIIAVLRPDQATKYRQMLDARHATERH